MITLVMIVRDEIPGIVRTLRSAIPYIDRWCIVDTGSKDSTPNVVRQILQDIPGTLHHREWVDYSHNRNQAIELAESAYPPPLGDRDLEFAPFLLLLDASDEITQFRGGWGKGDPGADVYNVTMCQQGHTWPSIRLIRVHAGWRYRGRVHELLEPPARTPIPAPGTALGIEITHHVDASHARSEKRWRRDVDWLRPGAIHGDARSVFYLGLTYVWLHEYELAKPWLARAAVHALCGIEQRYYALLQLAQLPGQTWHDSLEWADRAIQLIPDRPEAWELCARACAHMGMRYAAREHARAGVLARARGGLFYDTGCRDRLASYLQGE